MTVPSTPPAPATLTVVTSPRGHDVGPFVSWHAAQLPIGDGLAVRTVISDPASVKTARAGAYEHTSIAPAGTVIVKDGPNKGREAPQTPLWALPSAWQDPQTNLGVAFSGPPTRDVAFDVDTLAEIGWDPSSRLTVQHGGNQPGGIGADNVLIPQPIETGDLAVQARDAVLRSSPGGSRHVLVEAGDGQTFLTALAVLGLAPWSPAVEMLRLWLVVDVAHILHTVTNATGQPREVFLADQVAAEVVEQGGGFVRAAELGGGPAAHTVMRLALTGAHHLHPGIHGAGQHEFDALPPEGGLSDDILHAFNQQILTIERRCGVTVGAMHTGNHHDTITGQWVAFGDPR